MLLEAFLNLFCVAFVGNDLIIAGIDEAGRGPVFGPMVLCIASIKKNDEENLVKLNVRDSKQIPLNERNELFEKVKKELLEWKSVQVEAKEIDELMNRKSLNEIEALKAAELIDSLKQKPDIVFVDSPDLIQNNFALRIKKYLTSKVKIRAEHKADDNYPVVGAASIIAKVQRDNAVEVLSEKFGDIGSGYPHDPATIQFLKEWLKEKGELPEFARKKWSTSKNALDEKFQTKLL